MDRSTALSVSVVPARAVAPGGSASLQVERLMALAFFPGRAPRSAEYREGCQAALEYRILGRRMPPRYRAGSCEADAWFAGVEEGHSIWQSHRPAIGSDVVMSAETQS